MQELVSTMEQILKLVEGKKISTRSSSPDLSSKNFVVGVDEDLLQLKDRWIGMEIVPIVGMGGIGKIILARSYVMRSTHCFSF